MQRDTARRTRNIVTIGGSAGSLRAVRAILCQLPEELRAAIFFVQHMAPGAHSELAAILGRASRLPVGKAVEGDRIRPGKVWICDPDQHLLLGPRRMLLRRGPPENHARPAIDPLFRSAAASQQGRVVAVLLSGYLSDGVAGLDAVRRCGGVTIVQDPAEADFPDLPANAVENHKPDYVAAADRIAGLIAEIASQPAPPDRAVPEDIRMEVSFSKGQGLPPGAEQKLGGPTRFACPECGGYLRRLDQAFQRYRCDDGHVFTAGALAAAQGENLDLALWSALRGLRERARLLRNIAAQHRARGTTVGGRPEAQAGELDAQAAALSQFILSRHLAGKVERRPRAQHPDS